MNTVKTKTGSSRPHGSAQPAKIDSSRTGSRPAALRWQRICGLGIGGVGVLHTAAHFLIPQARTALFGIVQAGVINTLGMDWAAANFSVLMSLVVGFLLILTGIFVFEAAGAGWKVPRVPAVALLLVFLFIVAAGPNGGGWLGLPFCGFLVYQAYKGS